MFMIYLFPGFSVRWRMLHDRNSVGGVRNNNISTVADCQNYCLSKQDCVALDFNSNDNSCWLLFLDTVLSRYSQASTTQYRLGITCESQTTTGSTGLSVSSGKQ